MSLGKPETARSSLPVSRTRGQELLVFAVLAVLVWPVVAVGVVGGYGFAVWMYQHIAGPPGPPRH
jgi:nitrate reductase NapE